MFIESDNTLALCASLSGTRVSRLIDTIQKQHGKRIEIGKHADDQAGITYHRLIRQQSAEIEAAADNDQQIKTLKELHERQKKGFLSSLWTGRNFAKGLIKDNELTQKQSADISGASNNVVIKFNLTATNFDRIARTPQLQEEIAQTVGIETKIRLSHILADIYDQAGAPEAQDFLRSIPKGNQITTSFTKPSEGDGFNVHIPLPQQFRELVTPHIPRHGYDDRFDKSLLANRLLDKLSQHLS